jgi:hypothetical protein
MHLAEIIKQETNYEKFRIKEKELLKEAFSPDFRKSTTNTHNKL